LALSGPLHGGAPSRVLTMLDEVRPDGRCRALRKGPARPWRPADGASSHRIYRAEDPRARCAAPQPPKQLGAPRVEVAEALEQAALAELEARKPDRVLATNVEFWSARGARLRRGSSGAPSPRCSRARGPPAGRPTSWSRSARGRLIRPTRQVHRPAPPAALRPPGLDRRLGFERGPVGPVDRTRRASAPRRSAARASATRRACARSTVRADRPPPRS